MVKMSTTTSRLLYLSTGVGIGSVGGITVGSALFKRPSTDIDQHPAVISHVSGVERNQQRAGEIMR